MTRSTAMTVVAGTCMAVAAAAVAYSIAALDDGNRGGWIGACAVSGSVTTAGLYLLGRAHEAARHERSTR